MKNSSMNTHMGNITIDKEVISQYAGSVAMECFGIVGMAGVNMAKCDICGKGVHFGKHLSINGI